MVADQPLPVAGEGQVPATQPLLLPPVPSRLPPRPDDPATLWPFHVTDLPEPGPFVASDPTMPYDNHEDMVAP